MRLAQFTGRVGASGDEYRVTGSKRNYDKIQKIVAMREHLCINNGD